MRSLCALVVFAVALLGSTAALAEKRIFIVAITLAVPTAIFAEAGLSFLGIGINEPTPSLGKMVADSAQYIRVYWYLGFFPTLAIALAMLGFSFVGDGLRDAMDPRQN